ncbi:MAG: hypothetical protein ACTSUE_15355 [Promethearchaeota archaeon]
MTIEEPGSGLSTTITFFCNKETFLLIYHVFQPERCPELKMRSFKID